jgi:chromosome segregation ATPase
VKSVANRSREQLAELRAERDRLQAELTAAKSQREQALAKLAALESNQATMERTVGEVTQRIDATIDQLKAALEG